VVTAFRSATAMVIRAAEGDSEIVAARALLRCLDLDGQLVTADALHCQNETAQVVLDQGGDYLFRLKGNRPALHAMVDEAFADPAFRAPLPHAASTDADHGRIEERRAWAPRSQDLVPGAGGAARPRLPGHDRGHRHPRRRHPDDAPLSRVVAITDR